MIWEVQARLLFEREEEARKFYTACKTALKQAVTIKPDQVDQDYSAINLIENRHDETPPGDCKLLDMACTAETPLPARQP